MGAPTFRRQHLPGVTVIAIRGELDLATAGQAEAFIRLARRPGDEVVLDLAGIPFMDCSALTMLWRLHQDAGCDGGALRLVALRPEPARVLRLAGAERRLPVHRTLAEALAEATATPRQFRRRPRWACRTPAPTDR
ncbi:STAS domain-containing protein [Nonomuraea angiospora]|uniref:STAS domain-containing protein n=1 Tax=Nonomuraea angiospora TaxID=46172 RepID=UPI0029BE790D|nr:STAS domain-containing protein [Nonomuraea angiospora]MDX3109664.1 STAS domain-containing protein [Nonomuraea angiospora]